MSLDELIKSVATTIENEDQYIETPLSAKTVYKGGSRGIKEAK